MDYPFSTPYGALWKKYRPAILKLMVDAKQAPQEYQLFTHEVKSVVANSKSTAFTFRAYQGKAVASVKGSVIASDLLQTLTASKRAMELMETDTYEFTLKRDYKLQVTIVETL